MELSCVSPAPIWRRHLPWLALLLILVSFVIAVIRLHPANFFGYTEDDSIYFSSAKALAAGKGYLLASFPGAPAATKYPVLYPWMLSWVWRALPAFPANLTYAIAICVAFGALFLTTAFFFLRRLRGIGQWEALLLTAFCALHPLVLFYSGSVLSDIPFAAFAMGALLLADIALERKPSDAVVVCAGLLTGLAMSMRILGLPIATGIALAFCLRRSWRSLAVFVASVMPFLGVLVWRTTFSPAPASPVSGAASSSPAWTHTWTYYTSYIGAWKDAVPTLAVLLAMLKNNATVLICTPGSYLISPRPGAETLAETLLTAVITVFAMKGILREARHIAWKPIHLALPFYALLVLFWNYPQSDRFFIPFLPLFAAGIWLEGKYVANLARSSLSANKALFQRVLAMAFCLVIASFVSAVAMNYAGGIRSASAAKSKERAALLVEKREAYRWVSRSTTADTRLTAYEDAAAYLYTGRSTIRPFTFTTEEYYEPARLRRDLDHFADVSRTVGADYWIVSDDDYDIGWGDAYVKGSMRMKQMEESLPLVFVSRFGRVRIYSLTCVNHPDGPPCQSARAILFPAYDNVLGDNLP